MSELLQARYQARAKQVETIMEGFQDGLMVLAQNSTKSDELLQALLYTPPALLPQRIRGFSEHKDEVYELAMGSAIGETHHGRVLQLLDRLLTACNSEDPAFREIGIYPIGVDNLPLELLAVFREYPQILERIAREGDERGTANALNLLETPETPLMRYRKDLAEMKMELVPSVDNRGKIGRLPTRVEGVQLKLVYPGTESLPQLSFLVNTLEEPQA